jgi:hypothetical protein
LTNVEQLSVDEHSQMLGDRRPADLAKVLGDHPGGDLVVAWLPQDGTTGVGSETARNV